MDVRGRSVKTHKAKEFPMTIHPEIRKFWEDQGYTVGDAIDSLHDNSSCQYILAFKVSYMNYTQRIKIIGHIVNNIIEYYLFGRFRSEQETLRIIKMKAFL